MSSALALIVGAEFAYKVREAESGCWLWNGKRDCDGYGRFRDTRAHRWSYECYVGPVPDGLEIDHLCHVRACVNPQHLEAVTHAENVRRNYANQTACHRGHAFDDANTYRTKTGRRHCRKCNVIRSAAYKARRLAA